MQERILKREVIDNGRLDEKIALVGMASRDDGAVGCIDQTANTGEVAFIDDAGDIFMRL